MDSHQQQCVSRSLFSHCLQHWGWLDLFLSFAFIFLLVALGLCCCTRVFFSCGERRLLFVVMHKLLLAVASLVWSTGSRHMAVGSCSTQGVAPRQVESSQTRDQVCVPCIGRRILIHCATTEVPIFLIFSI